MPSPCFWGSAGPGPEAGGRRKHFPALEEVAAALSVPKAHSLSVTVLPSLTEVVWRAASQILLQESVPLCVLSGFLFCQQWDETEE